MDLYIFYVPKTINNQAYNKTRRQKEKFSEGTYTKTAVWPSHCFQSYKMYNKQHVDSFKI